MPFRCTDAKFVHKAFAAECRCCTVKKLQHNAYTRDGFGQSEMALNQQISRPNDVHKRPLLDVVGIGDKARHHAADKTGFQYQAIGTYSRNGSKQFITFWYSLTDLVGHVKEGEELLVFHDRTDLLPLLWRRVHTCWIVRTRM